MLSLQIHELNMTQVQLRVMLEAPSQLTAETRILIQPCMYLIVPALWQHQDGQLPKKTTQVTCGVLMLE